MEGLVGLDPTFTLLAGPLSSKHLGGQRLVVPAHRVVMDTLQYAFGADCS